MQTLSNKTERVQTKARMIEKQENLNNAPNTRRETSKLGEVLGPHIRERVQAKLIRDNPHLASNPETLTTITNNVIARGRAHKFIG